MDRNKIVDDILNRHLNEVEGYSSEVYDDEKGNPTVGTGINLRSPASEKAMDELGIIKKSAEESNIPLDDSDLDKIKTNIVGQKRDLLNNIKSQNFPNKDLNEAQEAALMSLTYNSPQLIGPNLRQHLNDNNDLDAMREILLNSNKDNSPGVQLRRLKETELYGGPQDFQNLIKTLSDEDKNRIYNSLNSIKNEEQKNHALEKYSQFSPSYKAPAEPLQFYKINKMLKGK